MYPNAITCTVLGGVRIPIVMESDQECIQCCLQTCNEIDKEHARIVRIPNSLNIGEIFLSEAYWDEVKDNEAYRGKLEIISEPENWKFDENGDLPMKNGSMIF